MKIWMALAAALLLLAAFGLIAAHLHMPNAAQTWRFAPRAYLRQGEEMQSPRPGGSVNVNTASLRELDTLPGIGPVLAERIVQERTENGSFHYPEDLLCVQGIGEKTLAKLLDGICIP